MAAGTLGRRLAAVLAAGGTDVRIFDVSADQRKAARVHAEQQASAVQSALALDPVEEGRLGVKSGRGFYDPAIDDA